MIRQSPCQMACNLDLGYLILFQWILRTQIRMERVELEGHE